MRPIITVEHLRKVYRVGNEKVVALNDIELEIGKGEMCCIVGASGSGKSTLLNQLAGLEKPTRGRVLIGRHEISAIKAHGPFIPRRAQTHRNVRWPAAARGHCPCLCGQTRRYFCR